MGYNETLSGQRDGSMAASMSTTERDAWTERAIRNHAFGSIAVGLIPFPLLDLATLVGIQLKLIHKLSGFYGIDFSEEKARGIIASLTGAAVPLGLTRAVCSFLRFIPIVGLASSVVSMSVLSAASTYAIGKLFVKHFESGGTFLNFDMNQAKSYYDEQVKKGKELMEKMKKDTSS